MTLLEISAKVAKLVHQENSTGHIYFDRNTYDYEEDMPHWGEKIINEVFISKTGKSFRIWTTDNLTKVIRISSIKDGSEDAEIVYDILAEMFYATKASWEIGDFELDFLKED